MLLNLETGSNANFISQIFNGVDQIVRSLLRIALIFLGIDCETTVKNCSPFAKLTW